jgi:hypothetical protein
MLDVPILLHDIESWTTNAKDKSRITAAEIKLMSCTAKYE